MHATPSLRRKPITTTTTSDTPTHLHPFSTRRTSATTSMKRFASAPQQHQYEIHGWFRQDLIDRFEAELNAAFCLDFTLPEVVSPLVTAQSQLRDQDRLQSQRPSSSRGRAATSYFSFEGLEQPQYLARSEDTPEVIERTECAGAPAAQKPFVSVPVVFEEHDAADGTTFWMIANTVTSSDAQEKSRHGRAVSGPSAGRSIVGLAELEGSRHSRGSSVA